MCCRFLMDEDSIRHLSDLSSDVDSVLRAGMIGPADSAPVLFDQGGSLCVRDMRFGFQNPRDASLLINARSETVFEKYTFRDSIRSRRCVLVCREFFEWNQKKERVSFTVPGRKQICMAGIWTGYADGARFAVLTTKANASMEKIHDRMPLMLTEDFLGEWLRAGEGYKEAFYMEQPYVLPFQEYEQLSLFDLYS